MDIVESFVQFVGNAVPGLFPLPPDPDALGDIVPLLDQVPRDALGIIGQEGDDSTAPLDSGDSAHKTGIAAFCNSTVDQGLLPLFEHDGIMVRHPSQEPWNNWKNCSRDQLMAYIAGCWRAKNTGIPARLLEAHATRIPPYTCQNTEADAPGTVKNPPIGDILAPHDVMALRIASGETGAYTDALGQFSLQAAIELADSSVDVEKISSSLLVPFAAVWTCTFKFMPTIRKIFFPIGLAGGKRGRSERPSFKQWRRSLSVMRAASQ